MVSSIGESIYCSEAAEFFTQSLECSLKEALFSLRKSCQTYAALEPAIHQIERLNGQLFRKMYECVRGRPGTKIFDLKKASRMRQSETEFRFLSSQAFHRKITRTSLWLLTVIYG